jgi:hypothetical protein
MIFLYLLTNVSEWNEEQSAPRSDSRTSRDGCLAYKTEQLVKYWRTCECEGGGVCFRLCVCGLVDRSFYSSFDPSHIFDHSPHIAHPQRHPSSSKDSKGYRRSHRPRGHQCGCTHYTVKEDPRREYDFGWSSLVIPSFARQSESGSSGLLQP